MIDRDHGLSIVKQAKALGISRGSVYDLPRPVSPADLAVMRRMDELHLDFPFAGSRMLRDLLRQEGITIGRRYVATLMKRMRSEALYRKPATSKPAPGRKEPGPTACKAGRGGDWRDKIYRYLLRGMTITRPNQVWCMPSATGSIRRPWRSGRSGPQRGIAKPGRQIPNQQSCRSRTRPASWRSASLRRCRMATAFTPCSPRSHT